MNTIYTAHMKIELVKERIQRAIGTSRYKSDIRRVAVFGSVARGDARPDSDVDLLIEFEPASSINTSKFSEIKSDFEHILGRPVDLVTRSGLSPFLRSNILTTSHLIYEK